MMLKSRQRATRSKSWAKQSQCLLSWGGCAENAGSGGCPSGPLRTLRSSWA